MRTSCNGCRVLRKGCSENCEIRPCLEWIKSPDSQANATLFLAKFYGRAGLLNLINAGAQNDRPGIFKSLLYEACGRIVNPTFGSVGLYSSGNWEKCQAAVDAVLAGSPIAGMNAVGACAGAGPFGPQLSATKPTQTTLNACDIRHVAKDSNIGKTTRNRSKKTRTKFQPRSVAEPSSGSVMAQYSNASVWVQMNPQEFCPSSSQGYGSGVERVEASMVLSRAIPDPVVGDDHHEEEEVGLELTLGFVSVKNREG